GTLFLKPLTPDLVVAGLLILIALYSLWSVWSVKEDSQSKMSNQSLVIKSSAAGVILGALTTLTGLGGGVIIVPILIKLFGRTYEEVLPTSLATVLVISLASFIFQSDVALELITYSQLFFLGTGALGAYLLLGLLMRSMDRSGTDRIRKIVFSIVTVFSAVSVASKAL